MVITRHIVAGKIGDYLHHRLSLRDLVDWAETEMMESDCDTSETQEVLARLGLADVRAFGLTWEDCQKLLGRLGFSARVEIVTA